jgi:hypothetical protein
MFKKQQADHPDIGVIDDGLRSQLRLDLVAKARNRRWAKTAYDKACAEVEAIEAALGVKAETLLKEWGLA